MLMFFDKRGKIWQHLQMSFSIPPEAVQQSFFFCMRARQSSKREVHAKSFWRMETAAKVGPTIIIKLKHLFVCARALLEPAEPLHARVTRLRKIINVLA
jgi:hypothetical protein